MKWSGDEYGAAHSMDTEWFAVDADGCVGRFDSGEDGAVPLRAAVGLSPAEGTFDDLLLRAVIVARRLAAGAEVRYSTPHGARRCIVVAGDLDDARFVRVAEGVYVTRAVEPEEALRELPAFRGFVSADDAYEALEGYDDVLFDYAHEHGEDPGLYHMHGGAAAPLRADELPSEVREAIEKIRVPGRFADGDVHLADFLKPEEAGTWGDLPLRYPPGGLVRRPPPSRLPLAIGAILVVGFVLSWWWFHR